MAKKMWGGRFSKKIDPLFEEFSKSIQYDWKLAQFDVLGSMSHVEILRKSGYLNAQEAKKLQAGLQSISESIGKGKFKFGFKCEDIHTDIQNALENEVGDLALKLHTARSRNDQVVFATKLYCKSAVCELKGGILKLKKIISDLADNNKEVIIPGFTHLQHAQPVYLKDYLGSYMAMLDRDCVRLGSASGNINLTMGSGALAGTPIDAAKYMIKSKEYVLEAAANSLDTVSSRDFVIEIISALSIAAMHLSRLAEDLILWSTKEFDFVDIDEAFCTGSSLMPQKKNADALELVRGYAGRLYGNLISVLVMMKGLPMAYNRDMQLDKEPLFNSVETVLGELEVLQGLIKALKFNKSKIKESLKDEALYATDLVYYLVGKKIPFKGAHDIIGRLVKYSLDNSIQIKDMPESLLKKFSDKFVKEEIVELFDPLVSVKSKKSIKRY